MVLMKVSEILKVCVASDIKEGKMDVGCNSKSDARPNEPRAIVPRTKMTTRVDSNIMLFLQLDSNVVDKNLRVVGGGGSEYVIAWQSNDQSQP
eukprot:116386-Amphidinium_carterae.3